MERIETPPTAIAAEYEREHAALFAHRALELQRRLEAEPGVAVTFVRRYPGREYPPARIEVEGMIGPASADSGKRPHAGSGTVLINHVGPGLFDVFDVPILAGRGFLDADFLDGARAVIVDQTFVDRIAGGANVVGRRIRYARSDEDAFGEPERARWFQIVGVVPAFPAPMLPAAFNQVESKLFHPVAPVQDGATMLIVRGRSGTASQLVAALRNITASVDPALQLHELMTATESRGQEQSPLRLLALGIVLVTASVLLLSAAGIYAMMSFTVARRRREIGIRSALGADPRRILSGIFARASAQLGVGVAVGLALAVVFEWGSGGWVMGARPAIVLPTAAALMLIVGLLAALGPARCGLAIQPTEALRED